MIPKKVRLLLVTLTLIASILACESSEQASIVDDDDAPTITTTVEVIEPYPDLSIDTPTSQFTSTPQYTPTPSPQGYATISVNSCNLRSGPGTNFSIVGSGEKDDVLPVFGKNQDGSWLWVDRSQPIWISSSLVGLNVDLSEISVVDEDIFITTHVVEADSPEIPESPTLTPTPEYLSCRDIEKQGSSFTEIQWEQYRSSLVGEKFPFTGTVLEVKKNGVVTLNNWPSECKRLTTSVYLYNIPIEVAIKLEKSQPIEGMGRIRAVYKRFGINIEVTVESYNLPVD